MYLCECMIHMFANAHRSQKRVLDLLELELQVVVHIYKTVHILNS